MIAEPRKGGTEPGLSAGFPFDFCHFFEVDRNNPAPLLLPLARGAMRFDWLLDLVGGRFRA